MRVLSVVVGLLLAPAIVDVLPGALAQQNGLWTRLRRAIGRRDDIVEPPYDLYGGPVPEEKAYTYPPYGYPPPPPPHKTSSIKTSKSTSKVLKQFVFGGLLLAGFRFTVVVYLWNLNYKCCWQQHHWWTATATATAIVIH
ncbi:hypothetical protein B0T17DRAFT_512752 [Bombardia bombarda]|uniref:Uncharacterized protein n=1 Tax=Bombardia bombarda TaxID=252184 RepID=A0AA39TLD9_9PEZI|nr:hypothetical protein B0T17DRAFT_512752 [Bombardia bombarda]